MHGQMRVRVTYFHNTFGDLLEFLSKQQLVLIGIPPAAASATAFGAYANSQSTTGDGVEFSVDAAGREGLASWRSPTPTSTPR